jgi:SAM-dependent methyltransferase
MPGMPSPEPPRQSALDMVEGLHLAHCFAALRGCGIFAGMETAVPAADLAKRHRLDEEMLAGSLAYLAARTDLVLRSDAGFAIGPGYDDEAGFLVDLYVRAFGPAAADFARTLRRPGKAGAKVDRRAQADAFEDDRGDRPLARLLRQLDFNHILDLGCGNAGVLRALAAANKGFVATGIDANPAMCRAARRLARAAGIDRRVRIVEGDARNPGRVLSAKDRASIEAIVARDFVNELCRNGGKAAVAWLRRMRRLFPGRVLVVADYYGGLGRPASPAIRSVLLHDFAQLMSGQGVPPGDMGGWQALYEAAGCRLRHAVEDDASPRFIHFVRLETDAQ